MQSKATLAGLARSLVASGGLHESLDGDEPLDPAEIQAALERAIARDLALESSDTVARGLAAHATEVGMRTLRRVNEGATDEDLTELERSGLEAIVRVIGRPALRFSEEGRVESPTNSSAN